MGWGEQALTNTHTHSVHRDTQGGRSLGQGSDAILTHVGAAHPLNKSMGNEYRENAVKRGVAGNEKHTHTQCPS